MIQLLTFEGRIFAQEVLSWTLIVVALIWGGMPERIIAATWLLVFKLSNRVYRAFVEVDYQGVEWFLASLDVLAGIIWIAVALYANRNYTFWIAGLQVLAIMAHFAQVLTDSASPLGYAIMIVAPSWFQLFAFAIGLTWHIKRKREFGPYREWRITGNRRPLFAGLNKTGTEKRPDVAHSDNSWRDDLK